VNLKETTYWASDLLPGEPTTTTRRVVQGFPEFTVAEVNIGVPVTRTTRPPPSRPSP